MTVRSALASALKFARTAAKHNAKVTATSLGREEENRPAVMVAGIDGGSGPRPPWPFRRRRRAHVHVPGEQA